MYYCENCYLLNEDDVCAFCGSRLTRGPKADDYCFIGTKTSPWAEMLQGILEDDHLPVIVRQWSPRTAAYTGEVGTRTDFFVPYRELDHARQLEQYGKALRRAYRSGRFLPMRRATLQRRTIRSGQVR